MTDAGSTLKEQVQEEIKDAMRSGEKVKLGALRFLMASVKNRDVQSSRHEREMTAIGNEPGPYPSARIVPAATSRYAVTRSSPGR